MVSVRAPNQLDLSSKSVRISCGRKKLEPMRKLEKNLKALRRLGQGSMPSLSLILTAIQMMKRRRTLVK